ncbi:MAG TPA: methyltransferase domain-containing protein, partial [Deltaproteobacteria bacterium]|nr:methyltransferase domain-containing protein [Deltaproteobacteria bacterium]
IGSITGKRRMKQCLACSKRFISEDWVCPRCGNIPESRNGYLSFTQPAADTGRGFDSGSYRHLARLEAKNFWFRSRNRLLIWALRRCFPDAERFLEIGSGTGFVLSGIRREFPKMKITGSDIYPQGLDYARERVSDAAFLHMDACAIPFEDEFDVIGAFDILEHIQDDALALREMYRAVHRGGGIVLTVPQYMWLWSAQDKAAFHVRRYSRGRLLKRVEEAGFTVGYMTSFITFLFPLLAVSRLCSRWMNRHDGAHDWTRELNLNPAANTLFEAICNAELFFVKKGVKMPAGGSLLCIGIKE